MLDGSDKFHIDQNGRITLRQSLPEGRYTARIRAADGGIPSKSTDESLTVVVGEENPIDDCPIFASNSRRRTITIPETHNTEVRKSIFSKCLWFLLSS